jgi:hypothetical protein
MKHVIEISFLVKGFIIFLVILSACILLDTCSTKHKNAGLYRAELQKSEMDQPNSSFRSYH